VSSIISRFGALRS